MARAVDELELLRSTPGSDNTSDLDIVWRTLDADETFISNLPFKERADIGYICEAEVLLHGHANCNCMRQHSTETIVLYLPHPPEINAFPVHYDIFNGEGGWLSQINNDGKFGANENSIGWIVKQPNTHSYGWVRNQRRRRL